MPDSLVTAKALITVGRAASWTSNLAKAWRKLREDRRKELVRAVDDFGDLEILANYYVEPDCQLHNPADEPTDEPVFDFRKPIGPSISGFLERPLPDHDGSHVMFILSDAGMGKSSLLMMLKLSHEMNFWPSDLRFELVKIGQNTQEQVEKIEDKARTVLLLDALDEDPTAWGRIEKRLKDLLVATKQFRQVLITCRTQFFPTNVEDKRFSKVVLGGFRCNLIYLSPFSDVQVDAYLENSIDWNWKERLTHRVGRTSPRKRKALAIMSSMSSLRMRPMLLSQIDRLMSAKVEKWDAYSVYDELIDRWLHREERKTEAAYPKDVLRKACRDLAVFLYKKGQRKISEKELDSVLLNSRASIKSLDVKGRALLNRTAVGDYRFAHYSIQEFFVAESFVLGEWTSKFEATDMVQTLVFAWLQIDAAVRVRELSWKFLGTRTEYILMNLANLTNASLHDANLASANLAGANLRNANLEGAKLSGAILIDANLEGANLRNAKLEGALLNGAKLRNAKLEGADFTDAELYGANLINANLTGASFDGVELNKATLMTKSQFDSLAVPPPPDELDFTDDPEQNE